MLLVIINPWLDHRFRYKMNSLLTCIIVPIIIMIIIVVIAVQELMVCYVVRPASVAIEKKIDFLSASKQLGVSYSLMRPLSSTTILQNESTDQ